MKLHAKAVLTFKQRQELKRLFATGEFTKIQLAASFAISPKTIHKWLQRGYCHDQSSAPRQHAHRVTEDYRQAVLIYRQAKPTHGPVRIEAELRTRFGQFAPSTL